MSALTYEIAIAMLSENLSIGQLKDIISRLSVKAEGLPNTVVSLVYSGVIPDGSQSGIFASELAKPMK
jgi:hypothetical protein